MTLFRETTHLSEIIQESEKGAVIIFKFSNNCGSSERLYIELQKKIKEKNIFSPIYLVTVQNQPVLSANISEWFKIKHETPQIIILNKGKVTFTAHHSKIEVSELK